VTVSPLVRNVLSTYAVRFVSVASGFVLFPVVAHHIGLARYGLWLLVSGSIGIFVVADLGMGTATLRQIADRHAHGDRDGLDRVVSTSLAFFAVLGIGLTVAYLGCMWLLWPRFQIPPGETRLALSMLLWAALSTFLFGLPLGVFGTTLVGIQRADVANALQLAQALVRFASIVALLWAGFDVLAVVIADAAIGIAVGCGYLVACRRLIPRLRPRVSLVSRSLLASMMPYSLRVFAMGLSALVIFQTDNLIIGAFLPVASVTIYAAAYRVYLVVRQFTYALINPLVPDAARATALAQPARVRALLVRGTKYSNGLTLLLAIPATLFAKPLLVAWAGADFARAAPSLQILLLSLLANNNHLVAFALLTGMGRIGAYLGYQVAWAAANVVLSVVLIQRLGLAGVALGTALPVVVLEPFYLRTAIRETGIDGRHFLVAAVLRPGLAAATAVAPVLTALALSARVTPLRACALTIGYAMLFLFAFSRLAIDAEDRRLLRRLLQRLTTLPRPGPATPSGPRRP
jgi:O-antigen/teichoic acid export membrane protein